MGTCLPPGASTHHKNCKQLFENESLNMEVGIACTNVDRVYPFQFKVYPFSFPPKNSDIPLYHIWRLGMVWK